MRIVNIMDVLGNRQRHVEGQGDERQESQEREKLGGSASATGTVNVGTGSAFINIGSTAASAIVLGRTGGSVTLGPPLTLGAAPTSNTQLGYTVFTEIPTAITLTTGTQVIATSSSISSTGIYTLNYSLRYNIPAGSSISGILIYLSISSPTNSGNVAYNSHPNIITGGGGVLALSGSWTGLINGGATFQIVSFNNTLNTGGGAVVIQPLFPFSNYSYTRIA
jgi:hypothetical protein